MSILRYRNKLKYLISPGDRAALCAALLPGGVLLVCLYLAKR